MGISARLVGVGTIAACVLVGAVSGAAGWPLQSSTHTVRNDHGGYVIDYAIRMKRMERDRRSVRFDGRCDSACTLYLALPSTSTCITPRARFGFHLPHSSSARGNRVAASYLLNTYPAWVRAWISANGGLTNRVKVMNYEFASRHMATCSQPSRSIMAVAPQPTGP